MYIYIMCVLMQISEISENNRGRLKIKMSYKYRDPHVKDKTVARPFYL